MATPLNASPTIRAAYSNWPRYNRILRDAVAGMSDAQLAITPGPERWPVWATIGHAACQRVFWLCVFAGEPGAERTPFPDSGNSCPGDEDLEHVLGPAQLAEALDSTFQIVEHCLDTWTLGSLAEEISRPAGGERRVYTRGSIIQRVFIHDVYHVAELNEALGIAGLPQVDPWD